MHCFAAHCGCELATFVHSDIAFPVHRSTGAVFSMSSTQSLRCSSVSFPCLPMDTQKLRWSSVGAVVGGGALADPAGPMHSMQSTASARTILP
jgi:hypothetical protein